jgi:hypothetical protein
MPRGLRKASAVFKEVLNQASKQLEVESAKAKTFQHRGIRGDERAAALASFFREHLSGAFGVAKGEAIDCFDNQTGQLDILIFDKYASAPISTQSENVLIPAEGLLAVLEVKTTLTQDELQRASASAQKVRQLRPFKNRFVAPRIDGKPAEDGTFRCFYGVFAYDTNLGEDDWLKKEFARVTVAAAKAKTSLDSIDIVAVLSRGLIRPGKPAGKTNDSPEATFLEFYLHVINFLSREYPRRPPVDWQNYTTKTAKGWTTLS